MSDVDCATAGEGERQQYGCDARWVCDPEHEGGGYWENAAIAPVQIDGEDMPVCPCRYIPQAPGFWREVTLMFQAYRKGFLPDTGGLNDQAAKGIEILQIVDQAVNEAERELQAQEANSKRGRSK